MQGRTSLLAGWQFYKQIYSKLYHRDELGKEAIKRQYRPQLQRYSS